MENHSKTMVGFFIVALAFLAGAQIPRTITVTGTVQDSATGLPVSGALVLLLDTATVPTDFSKLTGLQFDTTVSGADGKFSYSMNIAPASVILGVAVIKLGYQVKISAAIILPTATTVAIGVLKISAAADALDTIAVSGKVVDSLTSSPIQGALVVMSGLGALDTFSGNRVLTNADGTFSKQVIITKLTNLPMVGYVVTQLDYAAKVGQGQATGKQLDFGTIKLSPNTQAVLPRSGVFFTGIQPDAMRILSLDGKTLYDGPVMIFNKAVPNRNGIVMVTFKRKNRIIENTQVFLTR